MTTEEERRSLLHKLAERDVQEIYEFAMKRSEEIKRAALSDPEFEDRVLEDASWTISGPMAKDIRRYVAVALAMTADEMSFTEAQIVVKRLAMEMSQEEVDDAREYMYCTHQWERPEEDDGR
jgi:hypothetical protein